MHAKVRKIIIIMSFSLLVAILLLSAARKISSLALCPTVWEQAWEGIQDQKKEVTTDLIDVYLI